MPDEHGFYKQELVVGLIGGERPKAKRITDRVAEAMDEAAVERGIVRVDGPRFLGYDPASPVGPDGNPVFTNGERVARYMGWFMKVNDAPPF